LLRRNIEVFEARNPNDRNYWPETLRTDAELKLAQGRYAEASSELARSDELWPPDSTNDAVRHGINRVLEIRLALATGRFDATRRSALQSIRSTWPATQKDLPTVYVLASLTLGEADLHEDDLEGAASVARQLLERILKEPERETLADWESRARLLLGEALRRQGHGIEAREQMERAVDLRERFDYPQSPWLAQTRVALASCCGSDLPTEVRASHTHANRQHMPSSVGDDPQ